MILDGELLVTFFCGIVFQLQDFMSHKEVYQVLRNCVKEALQNEINGIEMKYTNAIHPITKSPQLIFSITRTVPNR